MIVWLDDERPMPSDYTHHVKSVGEAIELLKTGNVQQISLDNYLGSGMVEGWELVKWIANEAKMERLKKLKIKIHTIDPEKRCLMKEYIRNAYRAWMFQEQRENLDNLEKDLDF